MNITREDSDALNAIVKIQLAKEDYQPKVESVIKDYTRKVDLKGFRKGHVPPGVVKKMFGTQILAETLDKMLQEELDKYLNDNHVEILGYPLPRENSSQAFDINNPVDYEFLFELGLAPDFELSILSPKTKLPQYDIRVDDELIQEETERLRKRFGKMTNPETIEKEDSVYVELEELDASGSPKEGGVKNSTSIPLDIIKDKQLLDRILPLKKGDKIEINVWEAIDRDKEMIAKHILGIEKEQAEKINPVFGMTIKNINRVEQAELDQEFFDKVYGEGVVKSPEELKVKLTEEYKDYLGKQAVKKLHHDLIDKLLHETNIALPDAFLRRWIKVSNKNPITDEQLEKEYPIFTHDLKWNLIVNKIIKDNKLEVKGDEIKQKMRDTLKEQFKLYTKEEIKDEQLDQLAESFSNNEEQVKKAANTLMDEKIFSLLKQTFTMETKELTLKEFNQLS